MQKWFNKKKKDNKGFTLVELVIVVAILAILVGLLAPQYTKYVEKSRRSADVANLENLVKTFQVSASDPDYVILEGTYDIAMSTSGTTITAVPTGSLPTGAKTWINALTDFADITFATGTENPALKLKSSRWKAKGGIVTGIATEASMIGAKITVAATGAVTVKYDPADIKSEMSNDSTTP